MNIPSFLGAPTPILPSAPAVMGMRAGPLGGAPGYSLAFTMQQQQQNNWCWAATSTSVSLFYASASTWTQCTVATACLGGACCPSPTPCDVPYYLDRALAQTGNLRGAMVVGNIPPASIVVELQAKRPVCCHIAWAGGGGHFVAIVGYDPATDDVDVADPYHGSSTVPRTVFLTSYQGSGTWGYTYLTQ